MPNYELAARRAAKREGIDPDIFVAQLRQESGLKMGLTSPAGARDIAQFMPGTAKAYGVTLGDGRASDDLAGAARHMRDNLKMFGGDVRKALAAYNAGPGAVQKYGGVPPYRETQAYVKNILAAAGSAGSDGTPPRTSAAPKSREAPSTATQTIGGVDNRAARGALVASFLQGDTRFTRGTAADGKDASDPVDFALAMRSLKDVPGQTVPAAAPAVKSTPTSRPSSSSSGVVPLGGSKNGGKGAFSVSGPSPGRLKPELTSFAEKVASVYGGKLTGLDGSSHSKYTVNGNVSEHYTGNATDIFTIDGKPAVGDRLIRAGRAALIAAGMPREQALRAPGGLYNVGNHQIIFGVDGAANGGNHKDHLHISSRR